ncbi:UNVERIFIED_CONTAM: hypothetical protein Sradi_6527800 [Sesamum radiatum]|uniref:Uncharacterized protein n=1 Tax=Sesamum radiatum TaxID=300843 RepID=A0AAW2JWD8_SESRA
MSLPKCHSFDLGDNLEGMSDFNSINSIASKPSKQVEEVVSGSEGDDVCAEQFESENEEVGSKEEELDNEGEDVDNESEEVEVFEALGRPSIVMALGFDDGKHWGAQGFSMLCNMVSCGGR